LLDTNSKCTMQSLFGAIAIHGERCRCMNLLMGRLQKLDEKSPGTCSDKRSHMQRYVISGLAHSFHLSAAVVLRSCDYDPYPRDPRPSAKWRPPVSKLFKAEVGLQSRSRRCSKVHTHGRPKAAPQIASRIAASSLLRSGTLQHPLQPPCFDPVQT